MKLARLLESFEDIGIPYLESLIEEHPDASLQFLMNERNKHENALVASNGISVECNPSHIETLDAIDPSFHYLFDPYLCNPNLFKLIEIFNHLNIMRAEYLYNDNLNLADPNICIKTVHKFMSNINSHPEMEKYHRLRENNKTFQRKVGRIKGSKYLLKLCGFIHIESSSIFLFESTTNTECIQIIVQFLNEYMRHSKIRILPRAQADIKKQNEENIIETKENEQNEEKEAMSKEDIVRYHRLKNFGNTFHHSTKVSKSQIKTF